MKLRKGKKLFLAALCVVFSGAAIGQNFDLGQSEIEKSGHPDDATIDLKIDVTNISGSNLSVRVSREDIEVGNTMNLFCWGTNCYPPSTNLSPNPEIINNGATNSTFKGQLFPSGQEGTFVVRYCFIADEGGEDLCFDAKYISSSNVSINEYQLDNEIVSVGNVSPNPISGAGIAMLPVNMQNAVNPRIEILNALGQVVINEMVNPSADAVAINVSDLNTGIYFYQIVTETSKSTAKKMVVRK